MKCEKCNQEMELTLEDSFCGTAQYECRKCDLLCISREFGESKQYINLKDALNLESPSGNSMFEI